jgi:hypothetical protein
VKTKRFTFLFLISWCLFVLSFFLDSIRGGGWISTMKGWECARVSVGSCVEIFKGEFGWNIYHACFTVENLLLLISPMAVFRRDLNPRFFKFVKVSSVVAMLHVVSFAILTRGDDLLLGYYLWATAFIVFAVEWRRLGMRLGFVLPKIKAALVAA